MSLLLFGGGLDANATSNTSPLDYITLDDPLTKWVDTVNTLIDAGSNSSALILVATNATPVVANGNAALSGTMTVGSMVANAMVANTVTAPTMNVTTNLFLDANAVIQWNTYAGGFYMTDSQWIRTTFNRGVLAGEFCSDGVTVGYGGATAPVGGAVFANNVGIGAFPPSGRLHVSGGAVILDGATNVASTLSVSGQATLLSNISVGVSGGTANRLNISIDGSAIDNATYGRGIQITGNAASAGQMVAFVRQSNYVWSMGFAPGTNNFVIGQGKATDSQFSTANAFFAMDSNGNTAWGQYNSFAFKMGINGNLGVTGSGTFSGAISVNPGGGVGYVGLTGGGTGVPGYVNFYTGDGTRRGYIGWASGSNLEIASENGWNYRFSQRPSFAGATPLDSSNYNSYALPLTGGTISGNLTVGASDYNRPSAITIANDANWAFGMGSDNSSLYYMQVRFFGNGTANRGFRVADMAGGGSGTTCILINDQGTAVTGTLSATSTKSFRIPHPLPHLRETTHLIHAAIEAPRVDLIYRGRVQLYNGVAIVNIDREAGMTDGTFVRLVRDAQCFVTNNESWSRVRARVDGSMLYIECEDTSDCYSMIDWMVIGERWDDELVNSPVTDATGRLLVEVPRENH